MSRGRMELAEGMGCCLGPLLFLLLSAEGVALRKLLKYSSCISLLVQTIQIRHQVSCETMGNTLHTCQPRCGYTCLNLYYSTAEHDIVKSHRVYQEVGAAVMLQAHM